MSNRATAKRNAYLLREYGITCAQYNTMFKMQRGRCAICARPPKKNRLHVDHDHHDGRVRGLLCYFCNRRVVGRLTLENARKVVAYLEKDFDGRKIEAKEKPIRRRKHPVRKVREEILPAEDAIG